MKWKRVDEKRYMEMLEILPPAHWTGKGFLVGEPSSHRKCKLTNRLSATYQAFITYNGKFYEGDEPMTLGEFVAFDPRGVL